MSKFRTCAFTLQLAVILAACAQRTLAGDGGSAYSLLGIGDLRLSSDVRSAGMGFTGIGLPAATYINGYSPAAWSRINKTRVEGSVLYEGFNSTDGVNKRYLAKLDFNGAMLAFPISQSDGIVLAFGLTPYSKVNYDTYSTGTYATDGIDYTIHHVGSGGLSRGLLGLSWAPSASFSIGASFNYFFGTLNNATTLTSSTTGIAGGSVNGATTIRGTTGTFGVLWTGLGDIAPALKPFALGAVLTTRGNLRTSFENEYAYAAETDTVPGQSGSIVVPVAYGFGIGYQAGEAFVLAADYYAQPWGSSKIDGAVPAGIRNMSRFGVGAEHLTARELNASWVDKLSYRLGFYYMPTYYDINGHAVNEWGATVGLALPLSTESRMNFAFIYGGRGTTEGGLIKDKIYRLVISLNLGESWFIPFQED